GEAPDEDSRILDMMASGLTYVDMARELDTTEESVDRQVTELFGKLAAEAGRGASRAVDRLKQLHSAVVDREATTQTLRSFVPSQVVERLTAQDAMEFQEAQAATILFSDIRGCSTLHEDLPA